MIAPSVVDEISSNCLLSASRRLARIITSIYNEELQPLNIRATQLSLLVSIAKTGPVRRSNIGRYADIEASTITRNLAILISRSWIEEVDNGEDRRGKPLQISMEGRRVIEAAAPAWKRAQQRAYGQIGGRITLLSQRFNAAAPNEAEFEKRSKSNQEDNHV